MNPSIGTLPLGHFIKIIIIIIIIKCSTFSPIVLQQTASAFPSVANRFSALEHSMERKRQRGARSDASSSADLSAKAVCPTTKTDDFYSTGSDWEEECEGDDGRGRSRHEVVQ